MQTFAITRWVLALSLISTTSSIDAAPDIERIIPPSESKAEAMLDSPAAHAKKHADPNYICPMHPQIRQGEPGSCPICGMDLVLQEASDDTDDSATPSVKVNPSTAQSMGIRTRKIGQRNLARIIDTTGSVHYNEDNMSHVHARSTGWVEVLHARTEGEHVKQGEVLLEYYSPAILDAQHEFLLAKRTNDQRLLKSAENKLELLDVPAKIIRQLHKRSKPIRRIPLLAPQSGIITKLGIRDGMYIAPATELYTISKLDTVWVMVDVFEQHMDFLQTGNTAVINTAALPGHNWEGEVDYIYPDLDPNTRTLRARLKFAMPKAQLKPNMFVQARIYAPTRKALAIPREALIPASDGNRVVKVIEEGRYAPVTIETGMRAGDYVEVLSGLEAGDEIVVSGQFLIDSESSLQASFRRMSSE